MVFDSTDTEIQYSGKDMEEAYQMAISDCLEIVKNHYRIEAINLIEELRR